MSFRPVRKPTKTELARITNGFLYWCDVKNEWTKGTHKPNYLYQEETGDLFRWTGGSWYSVGWGLGPHLVQARLFNE
ncbi:MAG: hypothetical protein ACXABY_18385 [Candidatus Thorarchaeota archaeon]